MSALSFVDADGKTQARVWMGMRDRSSVLYDNHHLTAAAAPLLPAQYLFQRCCLLLIMSVGADLSFGDPLWKFKLQFGPVFFFF